MSTAEKNVMLTELVNLEAAAVAMGTAYSNYKQAAREAEAAAHARPYAHEQFVVGQVAGMSILDGLLIQRLRALGIESMLAPPRVDGAIGPEWVSALTAKITAIVP